MIYFYSIYLYFKLYFLFWYVKLFVAILLCFCIYSFLNYILFNISVYLYFYFSFSKFSILD